MSNSSSDNSEEEDWAGGATGGWDYGRDQKAMGGKTSSVASAPPFPVPPMSTTQSYQNTVVDFKTLTEWVTLESVDSLLRIMTDKKDWIRQTLCQLNAPSDQIHMFAMLFQKIIHKNSRESQLLVAKVMEVVAHSNYIDIHIPTFLSKTDQHLLERIYTSLQAFLNVLDYITIRFSDCSNKCYVCACKIEEFGSRLGIVREGNQLSSQCVQLKMKSCPIPLAEGAVLTNTHLKRWREKAIPHDDEDCPPDDFTEKSIFPDMEELENSCEPFLRANKTEGEYRDLRHYTDIHFRLMREDYMSPLREGIRCFKEADANNTDVISRDLRFYFGVKLVKMKINLFDGLHFLVKFDQKAFTDVDWQFSKRFLFGSLLAFSKDNFQTVMFATVINREPENLKQGWLEVIFQSDLEEVLTSSEYDSFVIAETINFFESYKHVLEGLQEVRSLPLDSYILYCETQPQPPEYLTPTTCYDIGCIMKEEAKKMVNILDPDDWPDYKSTVMNAAQLEAVKLALTNELAIIQGPPGTGKTYVGFHIMQLLLNNIHVELRSRSPILVVCFTNHALDQFLEGIMDFCEGGIIRVGGRSSSEKLEECNLKELRKNPKMDRRLKNSINNELKNSNQRLKKVSFLIKKQWQALLALDTNVQSSVTLEDEMTSNQLSSLCDSSRSGGHGKEMNVWLKASNASVEKHVTKAAERHLTELILSGTEVLPDDSLLNCDNVRVKFEIRAKVYRSWMVQYITATEIRLSKLVGSNLENNKMPIDHCIEGIEKAKNTILEDEVIIPFLSSGVFDKIKLCIQQEGKMCQDSYIKSWLFGSFTTVEDILDEIGKIKQITSTFSRPNVPYHFPIHRDVEDRVLIDDDDESLDNDFLGFQDNRNDESDDDNSSHDSETNQIVNQYKDLVVNYKENEGREDTLLERIKLLGIQFSQEEEEESNEGGEFQTHKQMNYSQVFNLIRKAKPMDEEESDKIEDVWSLPLRKRYSLYKLWVSKKKQKVAQEIIGLTSIYNNFLQLKKRALSRKDVAILKQGRVIGMTTTGAARYRAMLQQVKPQIVIVEEAAEVLEAHIVSTLNAHCQHLILIGDHQQLRPSPTVHTLAIDYGLEISLFERLVKNSVRHITLQIQHRMSPLIAKYLHNIYPNLRNHNSVYEYDDIRGVNTNVFFLTHNIRESNMAESRTKANIHEAQFLTKLCKYFLQQDYTGHQITILAAYSGQVSVIRECMEPEEDLYQFVRVTSIDNYQGEENDIILLSLVRSNLDNDVGFLKVSNRVCVALSRARQGLFVAGNLLQLEKTSKLWNNIVRIARKDLELGTALRLVCRNHPEDETYVKNAEDFALKAPEGGCSKVCGFELFCGHTCPRLCHSDDPLHREMFCNEQCQNKCPQGHPCVKKCHEECGVCEVLVMKKMPLCGHTDHIQCYLDPLEGVCKHPCGVMLACEHPCEGLCGNCRGNGQHRSCEQLVEKVWQVCGHKNTAACCTSTKIEPCPAKCFTKLDCGHKCKGTCGGCLSKRVHRICGSKCKKTLPCGHQCQGQCGAPCLPCILRCPTLCRHTSCSKTTCGEICDVCLENCDFVCKHKRCDARCGDQCDEPPCIKHCPKRTSCNHQCNSICGEICICYECEQKNFRLIDFSKTTSSKVAFADVDRAKKCTLDKETVFMKIPRCKHVFTLKQLDKYVDEFDPKGTSYVRCPACSNSIQTILRYDKLNKKRSFDRENKKQLLEKLTRASDAEIENVRGSLEIVEEFCPFDLDHYIKHREQPVRKSHVEALRFCARFAFVLHSIFDIHKEYNNGLRFQMEKWKESLQLHQTGITQQYESEMTLELHRLLIIEQIMSCMALSEHHHPSLPEQLKKQYKELKKIIPLKLTTPVKQETDIFIEKMYRHLKMCEANPETKIAVDKLFEKSRLAKIILDKPNAKELCDILEEENLPPVQIKTSGGACKDNDDHDHGDDDNGNFDDDDICNSDGDHYHDSDDDVYVSSFEDDH